MIRLVNTAGARRLLCLGAHSDDIELGCGGTILRMLRENAALHVHWVVLGATTDEREAEARRSAERFLEGARSKEIVVARFRDAYMPFIGERVKDFFESLKPAAPDLIFTHYRDDRHQDHRLVSDLTWNTWRSHAILEYEVLKYDGDLGRPNFFVSLPEDVCERKIALITEAFPSQGSRQWFSPDTFWAMLRIRGVECDSPTRFAEAFYCRKALL